MKKSLKLLLSFLMIFTLFGCQKKEETNLVKVGVSWAMDDESAKEDEDIQAYIQAITACGGQAVYLPAVSNMEEAQKALETVDCIVMTGGEDVDPSLYGDTTKEYCEESNQQRDISDTLYILTALDLDMPMLATCRGMQILNVTLGGTLYQDINSEYKNPNEVTETIEHRDPEFIDFTYHTIYVKENSLLASVMNNGAGEYTVNSWHHQAIKDLGTGLVVTALSTNDNIIEAVEVEGKKFALGVQFHPEWHIVEDTLDCTNIFKGLMEACK